jgi:hypothetical protein
MSAQCPDCPGSGRRADIDGQRLTWRRSGSSWRTRSRPSSITASSFWAAQCRRDRRLVALNERPQRAQQDQAHNADYDRQRHKPALGAKPALVVPLAWRWLHSIRSFYGTRAAFGPADVLSTYDKGKGRGGVRFGCSGCSGCSRYQIVRTNLCS